MSEQHSYNATFRYQQVSSTGNCRVENSVDKKAWFTMSWLEIDRKLLPCKLFYAFFYSGMQKSWYFIFLSNRFSIKVFYLNFCCHSKDFGRLFPVLRTIYNKMDCRHWLLVLFPVRFRSPR